MPVRVGFTLEQCWHRVPGGTAVSILGLANALIRRGDVELVGVAGRHAEPPENPWKPPIPVAQLRLGAPWLYLSWHHLRRPRVESATGPVDVVHATALTVPPKTAPLVVTVQDLAFLHNPEFHTRAGLHVMRRGFELARRHADVLLCPSVATAHDCADRGVDADRLRVVPHSTDQVAVGDVEIEQVRTAYGLGDRFVLWVGTIEPRKNLARLLRAFSRLPDDVELILVGPEGWNEEIGELGGRVRKLGFVPSEHLPALYAAASVFCYPSLLEGFGLPVLEAMVQGTPVVTSAGTSTAELVTGGAGLAVDPLDEEAIEEAMRTVLDDPDAAKAMGERARERAASMTWEKSAAQVAAIYKELAA